MKNPLDMTRTENPTPPPIRSFYPPLRHSASPSRIANLDIFCAESPLLQLSEIHGWRTYRCCPELATSTSGERPFNSRLLVPLPLRLAAALAGPCRPSQTMRSMTAQTLGEEAAECPTPNRRRHRSPCSEGTGTMSGSKRVRHRSLTEMAGPRRDSAACAPERPG